MDSNSTKRIDTLAALIITCVEQFSFFGLAMALITGLIMGLLGGGGSILTVPVFVYIMSIEPVFATAYSLFVVGSAAAVGAFRNFQNKTIDVRTAILFAIPSMLAVYFTRRLIIPAIPQEIATLGEFIITRDIFIMTFFATIMLLASFSMLRAKKENAETSEKMKINYPLILVEGFIVGILTGLVGAGGGFIIVPVLVVVAKIPMKIAIGTSLLIIAMKSLFGFIGDVQNLAMDWNFLLIFTALAIVGILIGNHFSRLIPSAKLKRAFGFFVIIMAFAILYMEFL